MKKALLAVVVLIVLAGAGSYGWRYYAATRTVLPDFTDLPPGPRAPAADGLGAQVGKTRFTEIEALGAQNGWSCKDTSARALMKIYREQKKKEREEKAARGEVDAVTKASGSGKASAMGQNPQIRWSCEDTTSDRLKDRARPLAKGRLLFIWDSPDHPLRHVSYRRQHADEAQALTDAQQTLAAMTARYGEPHKILKPLPDGVALGAKLFPRFDMYTYEWSWADVKVTVQVMGMAQGADVYEAVEVPWPVRAEAPALPADYVAPQKAP